jgi:hypothetical protein
MNVNINKEALIKHKFWIMLGIAVPLILAGIYTLEFPVAEATAKELKKVHQQDKSAKDPKGVYHNQKQIDDLLAEVKKAKQAEDRVWGHVFRDQIPLMFWPADFEKTYPFEKGKFIREVKYLEGNDGGTTAADHFVGKITERTNHFIKVQGKDPKTQKPVFETFYRVVVAPSNTPTPAPGEMKLPAGVSDFKDLTLGRTVDVMYQNARYFNDRLYENERFDYVRYYESQIRPILDQVDPVDETGEGVVVLNKWLVPKGSPTEAPPATAIAAKEIKFIRYVPKWVFNHDISEEAWMAQEDLWIQKELYRMIRVSNDYVSHMTGEPVKGLNKPAVFSNPYFKLTLTLLDQKRLQVKIQNLRATRQKLEISFRIRFNENTSFEPEKIKPIEGEPLEPFGTKGKDEKVAEVELTSGPPKTGIYAVSQVLTWETAAVRRIDHIAIGSMDVADMAVNHRLYADGTRLLVEKKEEVDPNAAPARPAIGGGVFAGPAKQAAVQLSINGIVKDRYLEVNDQARRIPVGIAMIVDQEHLGRILTAFENSKLRYVLNQVLVNRYPNSVRPPIAPKVDPMDPAAPMPKRGPFAPFVPFVAPAATPGAGGGGDENMEANVELVLYGTMTMYQRYPARPTAVAEAPK